MTILRLSRMFILSIALASMGCASTEDGGDGGNAGEGGAGSGGTGGQG
ncbi:MAG: di-heme enzyme, partial [Myxococcales bacterium]|nr:di-heme enzyme [Myxococcales bacterium]